MRSGSRVLPGIALGLFVLVVGCVGQSAKESTAAGGRSQSMQDFTLKDLNGADLRFSALLGRHKAVLLNFWATWCPPCREEIPDLIELQKKYGPDGFTVLGVDVGESQAKVSAFVKKIGINYPVVLDARQEVAGQYGVVGIPTTLLFSSQGNVLGEYHSYSSALEKDVEKAIR